MEDLNTRRDRESNEDLNIENQRSAYKGMAKDRQNMKRKTDKSKPGKREGRNKD